MSRSIEEIEKELDESWAVVHSAWHMICEATLRDARAAALKATTTDPAMLAACKRVEALDRELKAAKEAQTRCA